MNILFVLYGDLSSNSANPLALYACELAKYGHSCAVAIPSNLESVSCYPGVPFRTVLYGDVLSVQTAIFPDGRPADVVHAWTPRENVRRFVSSYMSKLPTPLVIYLEDHESWISCRALGLDEDSLGRQTEQSISERLPVALSHPFRYDSFIGLADAVVVIQEKLSVDVPAWVSCATVMPGVDLDLFCPHGSDDALRKRYGVTDNERVIVYPGGLNGFTRPAIEELCRAVGIINQRGYPCRLLRTGPFALDFLDALPKTAADAIVDLGVLPRNDLLALLALADVFVQPGKIDPFEDLRLPGKLPEFFAMGKPVITPDVNISHLFRDGVDVLLTRTGGAEEIAEKYIFLISNPCEAEKIGIEGRKFAEKNFNIKEQALKLAAAYKKATENFNITIAKKVWSNEIGSSSVYQQLALKLRLMADSEQNEYGVFSRRLLADYSDRIEGNQRRLNGLESEIDQLKNVVKVSMQTIEEIRGSSSWRITSPMRFVGRQVLRIKTVFKAFPYALMMCGGYRGLLRHMWVKFKAEGIRGIKRRIVFSAAPGARPADLGVGQAGVDYDEWVHRYDTVTDADRERIKEQIKRFDSAPLISIVMPVFNPPINMLEDAILSVQQQLYSNWELCIADDASTNLSVRDLLSRYSEKDSRIKVVFRKENGHISAATNSALEIAVGDWVAFLDHDDLLSEHALFWVVSELDRNAEIRLIYSDEDKISEEGRRFDPYFKCDWNVDLFYSHNLVTHLAVYQTGLLKEIGGCRQGVEGAQDYDLVLRFIEHIRPDQIYHIPRVLYHWRVHAESTAQGGDAKPYAMLAGEKALNEHFQRQRINAKAGLIGHGFRVRYALPETPPMVCLIIPTRNGLDLVRNCVQSILKKTTYSNYEILIVDNGSDDPATLKYFEGIKADSRVKVLRDDRPFNYSALNNAAAKITKAEILGLINNDIEVISPDWLSELVSIALQSGVGAVGAKLLYPDDTLQHGGVILGVGGFAGHAHKGFSRNSLGYAGRMSLISSFSAVTGACLVVRKALYDMLGGLNETDLSVACNDVDFCLRLREAGYRNIWTPYAELYHHESATRGYEDTPEKQLRFRKELQYMIERWGDGLKNDPAYSPNLTISSENFSYAYPPRVTPISKQEG